MRLRGQFGHEVVRPAQQRRVARGQVVQRRILDDEVSLPHRAADVHDRVTRSATQTCLRLRRVDLLPNRTIEPSVEEDGVIVAAGAPLRRAGADDVLHVLDGSAVPLVVERGEVVGGRIPLLVDVAVAAPAHLAGQEEIGRNDVAGGGPRRGREERAVRAVSLAFHRRRRAHRVDDTVRLAPLGIPGRAQGGRQEGRQCEDDEAAADRPRTRRDPNFRSNAPHMQGDECHAGRRHRHVEVEQPLVRPCRPQSQHAAAEQQSTAEQPQPGSQETPQRPRSTPSPQPGRHRQHEAEHRMRHDLDHVAERRTRRNCQPQRVQQQHGSDGEQKNRRAGGSAPVNGRLHAA